MSDALNSSKQRQLEIHRSNLARLEERAAKAGDETYLSLEDQNKLADVRENIARLEAEIAALSEGTRDEYGFHSNTGTVSRLRYYTSTVIVTILVSLIVLGTGSAIYEAVDASLKPYLWLYWPVILFAFGVSATLVATNVGNRRRANVNTDGNLGWDYIRERKEEIRIFGLTIWSVHSYEKQRKEYCLFGIPLWALSLNGLTISTVMTVGTIIGFTLGGTFLSIYSASDPLFQPPLQTPTAIALLPSDTPTISFHTPSRSPTLTPILATITTILSPSETSQIFSTATILVSPTPVPISTDSLPRATDTLEPPTPLPPTNTPAPPRTLTPSPLPNTPTITVVFGGAYSVDITQITIDEFKALPGCGEIASGIFGRPNNACIVGPGGITMSIVNQQTSLKVEFPSDARQIYMHWGDEVRIEVVSDARNVLLRTTGQNIVVVASDANYKISVTLME